jgi:hypothetical protein
MTPSQDADYIQKIANANTPRALELALQIDNSPASIARDNMLENNKQKKNKQKKDNELFFSVLLVAILEELIKIFIFEKYTASQKEKEATLLALTRNDKVPQQDLAKQEMLHPHKLFDDMKRYDADVLQFIYQKSVSNIIQLETQVHALDMRLTDLRTEEENNFIVWENQHTTRINEVVAGLQQENEADRFIRVRDAETGEFQNVRSESDAANVVLQQAFQLTPPAQLVRMIARPSESDSEENRIQRPELPLHLAQAQAISVMLGFARGAINLPEKEEGVVEENVGTLLLKALRENKSAIKQLGKPLNVEPYATQCNIEQTRQVVNKAKEKCEFEIKQERKTQGLAKQRFEELTKTSIETVAVSLSPKNNT